MKPSERDSVRPVTGGCARSSFDFGELLGGHADAEVGHRQQVAAALAPADDLDPGARCGELRRVVEQLGEEVRDVGRGVPEDVDIIESRNVDSRVVLDLADRGTHHVAEGDGLAPAAGGLDAGQDEQRLGVATHAGGEVVELEEVLERVGVGLRRLELVEEPDLTVEEALIATGEVDEQLADALAEEVRLLDGDLDRRLLDRGERLGQVTDLVLARCARPG